MKRRVLGSAVTLLVLACSANDKTIAPPSPLPPTIEAVFPAPRAIGIDFDTQIWAQFREPLDRTTVNDHTVFLKVDTRRLSAAVSYDTTLHRIRIVPLEALLLRRTHTIEISAQVRSAAGAPLQDGYDWQFTTVGVHIPVLRGPLDRDVDESPVAALVWQGTGVDAGPVSYDVYAGSDSVLVAGQVGVPWSITRAQTAYARTPWSLGEVVYWSVRATNVQTGERRSGPVWSFRVLPAGWPIDTLSIPLSHWGYVDNRVMVGQVCQGQLRVGPDYLTGAQWRFANIPSTRRIASARWIMSVTSANPDPVGRGPSVWAIRDPWAVCQLVPLGPPFVDDDLGPLAVGRSLTLPGLRGFAYESPLLASYVDGGVRYGTSNGLAVRDLINTVYNAPTADGFSAMRYFFYVRP